jgi:hypothetical protein
VRPDQSPRSNPAHSRAMEAGRRGALSSVRVFMASFFGARMGNHGDDTIPEIPHE